jgi:23S rRNA (adenine2503-C2)-methyltransferase
LTVNPLALPDLRSLPRPEIDALVTRLGGKPYRARQIFRWLHQRGAASLDEMTDLPAALRARLGSEARLEALSRAEERRSTDGTIKWTWRTADGKLVESVYMPEPGRKTLCLSTQAGCAVGCTFCMTGTMGLSRNLTSGEIVDQVSRANRRLLELGEGSRPRPLTNLVFMGMGEPLHNYENVKAALEVLLSEDGPNFSNRHVTVSTSGIVPEMRRFGEETDVKLAVSLNATTDEQRSALMPLNRRWPIAELLATCRALPLKRGRRITFEYVLLGGVNDTDEDAVRLSRLVRGMHAKVNLIPYNENPGLGFQGPVPGRAEAFQEILYRAQVNAVIRRNRGRDIAAACGQLAADGGPGDPRRRPRGAGSSPAEPAISPADPAQ